MLEEKGVGTEESALGSLQQHGNINSKEYVDRGFAEFKSLPPSNICALIPIPPHLWGQNSSRLSLTPVYDSTSKSCWLEKSVLASGSGVQERKRSEPPAGAGADEQLLGGWVRGSPSGFPVLRPGYKPIMSGGISEDLV